MTKKYVISSGHSKFVRGASGFIDEVDEARKVVNRVHAILTGEYNGVGAKYHDDTSRSQSQNLNNIVAYHNKQVRDLDISVHFNAAANKTATGAECLYYDAKILSAKMSKAMADALDILDRGPKERKELAFLRSTKEKAILLEVCFVSSQLDATRYKENFEVLCQGIAKVIAEELRYKKTATTVKQPTASTTDKQVSKNLGLATVLVDKLNYYNSPRWNNATGTVKKGEVFTVVEKIYVSGAQMYKLKSGNYITASSKYIKLKEL